jgi:uncharacterized phiE125 gp8 family phage protein
MWRAPVVSSAAAVEPLLVDDMILQMNAQGTLDDELIGAQIAVARAYVEDYTGTRLITQTLTLRTDDWADLDALPVAPVQSISGITYVDVDGTTHTLSATVYEARLYGLEPSVVLKYNQTWPTIRVGSQITVTAVVGYGAAGSNVPPPIMQAMKLVAADAYRFRETAQVGSVAGVYPVAATVENLLANHRKFV